MEKTKKKRKKNIANPLGRIEKKHWISFAVISLIVAIGSGAVLTKPPSFLRVNEIVVPKPTAHLKELDVVKLSGVKKGDPLLTLSLVKVRENILRYPWVKEVSLSKHIPGRLLIEVEERMPVALLEISSSSAKESGLYLLDGGGKIFKRLEAEDSKDLPLLTGLNKDEIQDHLRDYVRVLSWFDGEAFGVSELNWREGELTLFTQDPCIQISFGKDETKELSIWSARKIRLLQAWPTIKTASQTPRSIDLTLERRIVVKQKV